jgi:hypothetical protein
MYCSGCGQALEPGQGFCNRCGRPVPVAPSVPGLQFQLSAYASRIRALSVVWFIYAGLTLVFSFMGMAFARAFMFRHFGPWPHGPWMNGPFRPEWFGPAILQFLWLFALLYAVLLFAAGWGLMQHAPWGRIAAIVAAFLNLFKFPFGTALGIWTLVTLMGYRNQTLYDQLPDNPI